MLPEQARIAPEMLAKGVSAGANDEANRWRLHSISFAFALGSTAGRTLGPLINAMLTIVRRGVSRRVTASAPITCLPDRSRENRDSAQVQLQHLGRSLGAAKANRWKLPVKNEEHQPGL